jgi:cytochrome c553
MISPVSQAEQNQQPTLSDEEINELAGFFDALAMYDFEDNNKAKSALNSNALVSAPRGLELEADLQN